MEIGIGLPNPVPGTKGSDLLEFARRAERRGFAGLATIDRVAYPNFDSLSTLAAAAGATSTIKLTTNILLGPVYPSALLAKTAASIDQLSGGRLTLGLAPGSRADDYTVTDADFDSRGKAFDEQLEVLHRAWRGEPVLGSDQPIGPSPVHGGAVPVLFGGASTPAIRRTVEWGAGWTAGGVPPQMVAPFVTKVRDAWQQAGRSGEPRIAALNYFSLGDDATDASLHYLRDYYAVIGDYAEQIAQGALRTEQAIRETVKAFEDVGVTELYLDATTSDPEQVDRLADIVL